MPIYRTPKRDRHSRDLVNSNSSSDSSDSPSLKISKKTDMGLTKQDLADLRADIRKDTETLFEPMKLSLQKVTKSVNGLERVVRKNNIIIHGITEVANETLSMLVTVIRSFLDGIGLKNILLDNVMRMGKSVVGTNRPILLKLVSFLDKKLIFAAAKSAKTNSQKIYLNDDLSKEDQKQHKILREFFKTIKARDNDIKMSIRGSVLQVWKNSKVIQRYKVEDGSVSQI